MQTWKNFRFEQVRLDGRGSRGGDANLPRLDEQEEGLTCVCPLTVGGSHLEWGTFSRRLLFRGGRGFEDARGPSL